MTVGCDILACYSAATDRGDYTTPADWWTGHCTHRREVRLTACHIHSQNI